ncbi:hypothetical protein C8Q80DRAFT_272429 [Daedaleopsis nitida]|nr:hypothetical protein C8Q80DRAFT_272429 [Daedaleopsis nitida]
MTSTNILPQDKWELIIDFLGPDTLSGPSRHYPSLYACALTCRSWLPRAQYRLHKHVELTDLRSTELFARTLADSHSEHCARLVTRLEFWSLQRDWETAGVPVTGIPFPPSLIPTLENLVELRFACCTVSEEHLATQLMFVQEWAGCESVQTLWLDGFTFDTLEDLTHLVWSFPLLEDLNIFQTHWRDMGMPLEHPSVPGCCTTLQKVELNDITLVKQILPRLGNAIQTLSISQTWDFLGEDSYEALCALLDLRSLTVMFSEINYQWLSAVLSEVRSPHIEELILYFANGLGRGQDFEALDISAKEGLDDVLSNPPFENLRRLRVVTSGNDKTGKSISLAEKARGLLPRFHTRAAIVVELELVYTAVLVRKSKIRFALVQVI